MSEFHDTDPLMGHYDNDVIDFMDWTPEQLSIYLKRSGVPVGNIFIQHKIAGDIIGLLTDSDYQRMGIESVGDCLRLKRAVEVLQKKAKIVIRGVTLWEGDEYIIPNMCEYAFCRCCCTYDRDRYKLTNSSLQLTTKSPAYCCFMGPIEGCLATSIRKCNGAQYRVETISLDNITNIDVVTRTPSCMQTLCGMRGQDQILITTGGLTVNKGGGGKSEDAVHKEYTMFLEEGSGARVVQTIREVLAECSLMSTNSNSNNNNVKQPALSSSGGKMRR